MKKLLISSLSILLLVGCAQKPQEEAGSAADQILLKDFAPVNVNNLPETYVEKAKYAVIDMHSHDYAASAEEVDQWVANMDACGIEQTHVMHCSWIGEPFDSVLVKYANHTDRFRFWCCFDYTDFDKGPETAIAELIRCHELGAIGVGEMGDKGEGDLYARPVEGRGIHLDDPRMKPILDKCAELKMPISIHIAEPYWMYLPIDNTNDGLMNGANWHVDTTVPGCYDYDELMTSFENAVRENPDVIFIACHYLNMNQDYPRLSAMMDKYPNMYVDIAARVGEAAQTPRATRKFILEHQDKIIFGTDNGMDPHMYRNVFRVFETEDEHFYIPDFGYHWYYSAFYLPDEVLEKIYRTNALRILNEYK